MKKLILSTAFTVVCFVAMAQGRDKAVENERPNIVLIMVDDMGYSDLGSYGSEIETPNLDRLATEGLRLTEFYNNSICAPTRASLITGQYQHKAGMGYFNVNLGLPAYQGYINKESLTFGEVLREGGYQTYISGKWHVGNDSLSWPQQRGFDQSYGFIGALSNFFSTDNDLVELKHNSKTVVLDTGKYLTDEITDHALSFIENGDQDKPFFLYVPFNAPHWPLQARQEDIDKYKGRFDLGWDSLRTIRIEKLIALGLLSPEQTIAERDPTIPYWNSLTYEEKEFWKVKMEVFAAMVDRVDQNVGKLLDKLKELGKDDNTLIVFISDNGPQGGLRGVSTSPDTRVGRSPRANVRNGGPLGSANSYGFQEQPWAYLSKTPLAEYKNNMHEGGISSPLIAWYPKKIKAGRIARGTGHIIDLAPTFYELARVIYPTNYNGVTPHELPGKSLLPLFFENRDTVDRVEPLFWERAGNRAVRKGKWKLVSTYPSYTWELYDVSVDRGETKNIAAQYSKVVNELSEAYFKWAKANDVEDYEKIRPQRERQQNSSSQTNKQQNTSNRIL